MIRETTWSIDNEPYTHEQYGEILVTAEGVITAYYPATMYRKNGDPGDPEEGGETEVQSCSAMYEETCTAVEGFTEDDIPQWWWDEKAAEHSYYSYDDPPEDD